MTAGGDAAAGPGARRSTPRPRATPSSSARWCGCSPARAGSPTPIGRLGAPRSPRACARSSAAASTGSREETNEALKVAAAIGREFDAELADRVAELSPDGADEGGAGGDRRAARHRPRRRALLVLPRAGPRHALRGAQPGPARRAARADRASRSRRSAATTRASASASSPTTSWPPPRAATSRRRSTTPSAPASRTWSSSPTRRRPRSTSARSRSST